jgi:hypothetical protein
LTPSLIRNYAIVAFGNCHNQNLKQFFYKKYFQFSVSFVDAKQISA